MKKRLKQLISLLLVVLLVGGTVSTVAAAGYDVTYALTNASGAPGDTVQIDLSVVCDTRVSLLMLKDLAFDTTALELKKIEIDKSSPVISNAVSGGESVLYGNDVVLSYMNEMDDLAGDICTLTFKIKDNAAGGSYAVTGTFEALVSSNPVSCNSPTATITVSAGAEEEEHEHEKRPYWTTNDAYHWHGCKDFSCDMVWDKENHIDEDTNGICDVCHYFKSGTYYGAVSLPLVSGEVGDTVELPLYLQTNIPMSALEFKNLSYNTKALKFNGFKDCLDNGNIVDSDFDSKRGTIDVTFSHGLYTRNTVCTLSFTILDGATADSYDITFTANLKYGTSALSNIGIQKGTVNIIGNTGSSCTFSDEWSANETHHWHECTDSGCEEVSDYGRHDFDKWTVTVEPTDEEGEKERTCKECGYTQTEEVDPDDDNDVTGNWNNPFIDILMVGSSSKAIQYVYENGLFEGVSKNEFAPHMTMTRGMFVTVLGRLEGINEEVYGGSAFYDVQPSTWYAPGVAWASQNGIVQGYGDGSFGVNDEITVEQAVVILARYAKYLGIDTASDYQLTKFSDRNFVSPWAIAQMQWAVEQDIYDGSGKSLVPQKSASRELVAELIYHFASEYLN